MIQKQLFDDINNIENFNKANSHGIKYLKESFTRSVFPTDQALSDLSFFDEPIPTDFTPTMDIINKLNKYGAPGTVSQVGGRYFGFVDGSMVPAGLASRILSDYWDQNTAMYAMSPIASKLESVVEKWLVDLFSLPKSTKAGFVSGSSMATLCGLAAARYKILKNNNWDINKKGLNGSPSIRIVTGNQVHSTVLKAVGLLGLGIDNIEFVETDDQGRIIPNKIPPLDENTILILQAGNVNTGAFDNIKTIIDGIEISPWIHIDGAFGLPCRFVKELKTLTAGMEFADSWSFDGHKTLNTPYDNGILLCKDADALVGALKMSGAYIPPSENRDGINFTPEMSRRARVIELWATLRSLGRRGLNDMIYGLHLRTKQFAKELKDIGFEILNDIHFNQILLCFKDGETTMSILKVVQDDGICWCGKSVWKGKDVIRISVSSWATTEEDISISAASFKRAKSLFN